VAAHSDGRKPNQGQVKNSDKGSPRPSGQSHHQQFRGVCAKRARVSAPLRAAGWDTCRRQGKVSEPQRREELWVTARPLSAAAALAVAAKWNGRRRWRSPEERGGRGRKGKAQQQKSDAAWWGPRLGRLLLPPLSLHREDRRWGDSDGSVCLTWWVRRCVGPSASE
jgi:hypothetical protein